MDTFDASVTQSRLKELNAYRLEAREREVGPIGRGRSIKFGHGSLKFHE